MEINSKIHAEQLAPPDVQRGVQWQRSHKRDGQTNRQKSGLPWWRVKFEPHQTWLSDRGP